MELLLKASQVPPFYDSRRGMAEPLLIGIYDVLPTLALLPGGCKSIAQDTVMHLLAGEVGLSSVCTTSTRGKSRTSLQKPLQCHRKVDILAATW